MSETSETEFAGYRFHRVLGDSGKFEATEVESGDAVVIETAIGPAAVDSDVREWFAWAWEALAEVDHPNLPRVRAVSERSGVPFVVRDPVDGLPATSLEGDAALRAQAIRILICRLADGLEEAHEAGVIHGSLGPDDVIVEAEDQRAAIDATGTLLGFGRAEGSRGEDIRDLGVILELLIRAEGAAHAAVEREAAIGGEASADGEAEADAEDEGEDAGEGEWDDAADEAAPPAVSLERSPTERAILAMLARVAGEARAGGYRSAAEMRDAVAAGSSPGRPDGRRRWGWALALLLVAAAALVAVLIFAGGDGEEDVLPEAQAPTQSSTTPVEIGAGVGDPIRTPGPPRGVSVRGGVVYAATNRLLGFNDPAGTLELEPVELGEQGGELTVVADTAYVTLPEADALAQVDLTDPQAGPETVGVGAGPAAVIGAEGSIWVANEGSGDLSRVDPTTGAAEQLEIGASAPSGIAYGFDSLWVSDTAGPLLRIDPDDPSGARSYEVGKDAAAVLVTDDRVWVANAGSGTVTGLAPATGATETIEVGGEPLDLAADPERLWVSNGEGYVSGITASSGEVERVDLPSALGTPGSIAVGERVWVATVGGDFIVPIG